MEFTVFAFSPIPDLVTARHNFSLEDLSDKDVAKVLYHQRKQRTGHSEVLTWDQQAIASISFVQHKAGKITYGNYVLGDYQEKELLLHFLQAYAETLSAVFWQAKAIQLPLLKFRLMKHHLYSEDFAQALKSRDRLLDLCDWFSQDDNGHPSLDDIAQRFSLPGMQQHTIDTVWKAYLQKDSLGISCYSDYQALNTYVLALKAFELEGDVQPDESTQAQQSLREQLQIKGSTFAAYWDNNA